MEREEFVKALASRLEISRRSLKGFVQSRANTELLKLYTPFLDEKTPKNIRCWHLIYNVKDKQLCKTCKNKTTKFNNNKWGYLDYCSVKCQRNSDAVKEKLKQSLENKYGKGIVNPFMSQEVKDTTKKKLIEKYGVDHNFKRKDLIREAIQKKYGVSHFSRTPEFRERYSRTMLENYGVSHFSQTLEFKEKCKKTWQASLGVDHPMHDPDISQKVLEKLHKFKEVSLPSGKSIKLQGYEPEAISVLLETHEEIDIISGKKEIESYIGKILYRDFSGKERRYYPDFFIKSENKIVEVKSTWTYDRNGKIPTDQNINNLKKDACISLGFCFCFMIFDKNLDIRYL